LPPPNASVVPFIIDNIYYRCTTLLSPLSPFLPLLTLVASSLLSDFRTRRCARKGCGFYISLWHFVAFTIRISSEKDLRAFSELRAAPLYAFVFFQSLIDDCLIVFADTDSSRKTPQFREKGTVIATIKVDIYMFCT